MTEKPFEEARDIADRLAAAGWGSPALDQLRQKLHELAPKNPAMTHPEFAQRDLTYTNTSSAKARIEELETHIEELEIQLKLFEAGTRWIDSLPERNDGEVFSIRLTGMLTRLLKQARAGIPQESGDE